MECHTGNAYRSLDLCFTHAEVQSHRSCSQNATAIRRMVYGGLDKNNYIQTLLENVDSIQIGIQHEYSVNTSIHLHSDSNENYFKLHSPTMIDEIWAL